MKKNRIYYVLALATFLILAYENYNHYQVSTNWHWLKGNLIQLETLLKMNPDEKGNSDAQDRYEKEKHYVGSNVHSLCTHADMVFTQDYSKYIALADQMKVITTWNNELIAVPNSNTTILSNLRSQCGPLTIKYSLVSAFNGILASFAVLFTLLGIKAQATDKNKTEA